MKIDLGVTVRKVRIKTLGCWLGDGKGGHESRNQGMQAASRSWKRK